MNLFFRNMTLYDQTKITKLEHTSTVQDALPAKIHVRDGILRFVEAPLK